MKPRDYSFPGEIHMEPGEIHEPTNTVGAYPQALESALADVARKDVAAIPQLRGRDREDVPWKDDLSLITGRNMGL